IGWIMEDSQRRLWAAGERGLAVRERGAWRRLTASDGLRVTRTTYVMERRSGELCVAYFEAAGASCFRWEGGRPALMRHLGAGTELAGTRVYLMGEDRQGRLWIGTGNGRHIFGMEDQ